MRPWVVLYQFGSHRRRKSFSTELEAQDRASKMKEQGHVSVQVIEKELIESHFQGMLSKATENADRLRQAVDSGHIDSLGKEVEELEAQALSKHNDAIAAHDAREALQDPPEDVTEADSSKSAVL